jgi:hypothetical protein
LLQIVEVDCQGGEIIVLELRYPAAPTETDDAITLLQQQACRRKADA